MPKTKQQEAQEKRLQRNIKQAQKNRAEVKKAGKQQVSHKKSSGKGGFFRWNEKNRAADCPANNPLQRNVS